MICLLVILVFSFSISLFVCEDCRHLALQNNRAARRREYERLRAAVSELGFQAVKDSLVPGLKRKPKERRTKQDKRNKEQ